MLTSKRPSRFARSLRQLTDRIGPRWTAQTIRARDWWAANKAARAASHVRRVKDWHILKWTWREFLRPRMPLSLLALVFMVVEALTVGAVSAMMRPLFDDFLVDGQQSHIAWIALAMGGLFILKGAAHFAHRTLIGWQAKLARLAAQKAVMRHLFVMDQGFYQGYAPGELIARVKGDTGAVGGLLSVLLVKLGRDATTAVVLFGVVLWTDWLWTLIALIVIPAIMYPLRRLQKLIRKRSRQVLEVNAAITNRLDESFHGIRAIQLAGTEDYEFNRFEKLKHNHLRKSIKVMLAKASVPLLMDVSLGIGMALVLFFGGMQIINGTHTVGQLMTFFTALGLLADPLRRLAVFSAVWQSKLAALERTHDLLQLVPVVRTTAETPFPVSDLPNLGMEFRDVSFRYGDNPVLEDISFQIEPGSTTAIVGPSGAGKTTVFSLMTRFFDPVSGAIRIGGQDIRSLDLHELRKLFAIVSQETALFDETIRENVLMGRKGISDAELAHALEAANVTEFLPMMSKGLDTLVGPRGSALSGGQRQRVIIARAVLSDAPILLLDEATSALDSRSEQLVQDAIAKVSRDRTTVTIAHRLSTVRRADTILVMQNGRIIERGTHDALLAARGFYSDMHEKQML